MARDCSEGWCALSVPWATLGRYSDMRFCLCFACTQIVGQCKQNRDRTRALIGRLLYYHVTLPVRPSTLSGIFRQLCPRCRSGRIFRSSLYWGFPRMNDRCPVCGLNFNREPGYFLGAMYISYGLALALIFVFGAILWLATSWRVDKIAIWAVVFFLPFVPILTFLSRVLWIYLDQTFDPEGK
jgi:uncharacterized protein (DUF983 family)